MKLPTRLTLLSIFAGLSFVALTRAGFVFQEQGKQPQIAVDPQTGRAVGAKEIAPDELQKLIAEKAKVILFDVRDEAQYQQETIKGAIHLPMSELETRLKDIPKDTILVFT